MSKPNVYTVVLVRPACLTDNDDIEAGKVDAYVATVVALDIKSGVSRARDEVFKADKTDMPGMLALHGVKLKHYRVAAVFEGTCNQVGYNFDNF